MEPSCPGPSGPEGQGKVLRVPQATSRAVQAHPRGRCFPTPAPTGAKSPAPGQCLGQSFQELQSSRSSHGGQSVSVPRATHSTDRADTQADC